MRYTTKREEAERATYALPLGSLALQSDLSKGVRALVLVAMAILVTAVPVSFLVGRHMYHEAQLDRKLSADLLELEQVWARTAALGPIQDLIGGYGAFLAIAEMNEEDPTIWFGVERLAREALIARTPSMLLLRDRVLFTLRNFTPPDDYGGIFRAQTFLAGG